MDRRREAHFEQRPRRNQVEHNLPPYSPAGETLITQGVRAPALSPGLVLAAGTSRGRLADRALCVAGPPTRKAEAHARTREERGILAHVEARSSRKRWACMTPEAVEGVGFEREHPL